MNLLSFLFSSYFDVSQVCYSVLKESRGNHKKAAVLFLKTVQPRSAFPFPKAVKQQFVKSVLLPFETVRQAHIQGPHEKR